MPRGVSRFFNWHADAPAHPSAPNGGGNWDLKADFGASLSDGAISTLLAPPAVKERVSNTSRLEDGKRIDIYNPVRWESRELTLEMHIIADSFTDLLEKYRSLIAELTYSPGGIKLFYSNYDLSSSNATRLTFKLHYLSCTAFAVYGGTLAKFAVRFIEEKPSFGVPDQTTLNMNNGEE